jgi:hypothetical protein
MVVLGLSLWRACCFQSVVGNIAVIEPSRHMEMQREERLLMGCCISTSVDCRSKNVRVLSVIITELELGDMGNIKMTFVSEPDKHAYNYRTPGLQQDHADDLAMNKANEDARHEVEVQLNLVGDPSIDVGMGLQLIGTAFAQTFEMDQICHDISEHGYRMQVIAKSARQGRSAS